MNFELLFHRNSIVPRMTVIACLITVVVFIGLALGGGDMTWEQAARWGHFPSSVIWEGKPWMLITSAFVHFEIWHIAFNLYWLWILGNCLEDAIGPWRWLLFFIGAAWVSSSFQLLTGGDTGIGMSGVGYALFGFGWVARHKIPSFRLLLNQQTINLFLIWLVVCVFLTYTNALNVANMAHFAGMVFGIAVASVFVEHWRLPISIPGLVILCVASLTPLFWCPLSADWTSQKAIQTKQLGKLDESLYWYQMMVRFNDSDEEKGWALFNMALIYSQQKKQKEFADTVEELRKVDPERANLLGNLSELEESESNSN